MVDIPLEILPRTSPLRLDAVITPVATMPPVEFIPTPSAKLPKLSVLLPPTWKENLGSTVLTPTFPLAYMLVYPDPTSILSHCDVGTFCKYCPSPKYVTIPLVAVTTPAGDPTATP